MKVKEISDEVKRILKHAARKMTGATRRAYLAEVTLELCDGNARQAERGFGWGRGTITKGLRERATGIQCMPNVAEREPRSSSPRWVRIFVGLWIRKVKRIRNFRRRLRIRG